MDEKDKKHIDSLLSYSYLSVTDLVGEIKEIPGGKEYIKEKTGEKNLHNGIRKLISKGQETEDTSPYYAGRTLAKAVADKKRDS